MTQFDVHSGCESYCVNLILVVYVFVDVHSGCESYYLNLILVVYDSI